MIKDRLKSFHSLIVSIAFGLMFLCLPISSFPYLSRIFGGTSVAPLSVVPAFLLVLILVIPNLIKTKLFSSQFKPLFLFFLLALVSTLLMYFRNVPTFRETHFIKNALEGFITLLMGIAFYYICAHFLKSEDKVKTAIQWMNVGFILITVFSIVQAIFMYKPLDQYPHWLKQMSLFISSSNKIYPRRISGLAFEPSWLAHQLNLLFIPIYLGFTIKEYSVYKIRIFNKFSLENIFLPVSIGLLFLSFSRIGWLTFLILVVYLLIRAANLLIKKVIARIEYKREKPLTKIVQLLIQAGIWLAGILIAIGLAVLAALLISKVDPVRTAALIDLKAIRRLGIYGWANLIQIAERLMYWISGFRIFQLHPLIGVGLGAIGYYFSGVVPAFGYMLPEVVRSINQEMFIPNAKNLWARLLGETGIIGTALFVSWVYLHWKSAKDLEKEKESKFFQAMALVGKLFVIAFVIEGFSMDTFGLPYYWVAFGLLVAAWRIMKSTQKQEYLTQTQDSQLAESGV